MNDVVSSSDAMRRSLMPVRLVIHSSDVGHDARRRIEAPAGYERVLRH
jgi:hypothetical protein